MPTDYVKVYRKFFMGSMSDAPPWPRLTFLAMLSLADDTGFVDGTPKQIAAYGSIPQEDIGAALDFLQKPDSESSTPDLDGRRITLVSPNRWHITNYRTYYELNRAEERREYLTQKKRDQRVREKEAMSTPVNKSRDVNPIGTEQSGAKNPPKSPIGGSRSASASHARQTGPKRTASGRGIGPAPAEAGLKKSNPSPEIPESLLSELDE